MKWFISTHRIREDAIPTWMGATTKAEHEGIEFLGLVPDSESKVTTVKRSQHYANGVRNKGIKAADLVLTNLPATIDELKEAFVAKGFAETSAAPATSVLIASGKVERGKDKVYRKVA